MGLLDLIPITLSGTAIWMFYILSSRVRKKPANAYLAFLMLAMLLVIFQLINYKNEMYMTDRYILFLPITWTTAVGAISFLYLRGLLYNRRKLRWSELLFFIPFMIQIGFHTYWYVQPFEVKLDFFLTTYLPWGMGYENMIALLYTIPLDVAAFVMTMRFTKKNWDLVTKGSKPILFWARSLSILFLIRSATYLTNVLLVWVFNMGSPQTEIVYLVVMEIAVIIIWLAFYITKHPIITTEYIEYKAPPPEKARLGEKMEKLVQEAMHDQDTGSDPWLHRQN